MQLTFRDGLIPAIIQDRGTGKVLMIGYMNREAYERTLETGQVTFFSRSRNKLWRTTPVQDDTGAQSRSLEIRMPQRGK